MERRDIPDLGAAIHPSSARGCVGIHGCKKIHPGQREPTGVVMVLETSKLTFCAGSCQPGTLPGRSLMHGWRDQDGTGFKPSARGALRQPLTAIRSGYHQRLTPASIPPCMETLFPEGWKIRQFPPFDGKLKSARRKGCPTSRRLRILPQRLEHIRDG